MNGDFKLKLKSWWKVFKFESIQEGVRLFTIYNYLLVFIGFVILILNVNTYNYLYGNSHYVTKLTLDDYRNTLKSINIFLDYIFWFFIALYTFSAISFFIFIKRIHIKKKIHIDAIIINTLYFITIAYEFYSVGKDWQFILLALVPPIIYFATIIKLKLDMKINQWLPILKKSFIFFITSYIVIHASFFVETFLIIQKDLTHQTKQYFENKSDIFISNMKKYSLDKKNEIKNEIKKSLEIYKKNIFHDSQNQWLEIEKMLVIIEKKYNIQINKKQVHIIFLKDIVDNY